MSTQPAKLRSVDPETDFPRLAELMSMFEPEPITAEDVQLWREQAPAERIHHRMAALDEQGRLKRKLYEINRRYALDIPGREQDFPPFEQFQKNVFAAPWYRADAEIVAAAEDRRVGLTAAGYFPTNNYMYNMMTGVEPSYRGRHIALALKLLVIKCARRYGAAYLRTNNDSGNAPMLAVNRKLGYQPQPGRYLLVQDLS